MRESVCEEARATCMACQDGERVGARGVCSAWTKGTPPSDKILIYTPTNLSRRASRPSRPHAIRLISKFTRRIGQPQNLCVDLE